MRVRISIMIVCTCFAILASGQEPSASPAVATWNEFHRPNMQRWNQSETVLGIHNVKNLQLKWTFTTNAQAGSCPTIVNGVAYVDSDDGVLYALNANTGTLMWSYATGGGESTPAVVGGTVYVGSWSGKVYALKAATGALLWSFTAGAMIESSPAVVNGVVYVGSADGNLYALNAGTGAKIWSFATGANVFTSPSVLNGVVYFDPTTTTCTP